MIYIFLPKSEKHVKDKREIGHCAVLSILKTVVLDRIFGSHVEALTMRPGVLGKQSQK